MAFDPDLDSEPASPPAAHDRAMRPDPRPAAGREHVDHIPFLYDTDPLNPIYAPPVLIEDLNADPGPPLQTPDPIPDPEPPSPSLPSPDPGIFHPGTDKPLP